MFSVKSIFIVVLLVMFVKITFVKLLEEIILLNYLTMHNPFVYYFT